MDDSKRVSADEIASSTDTPLLHGKASPNREPPILSVRNLNVYFDTPSGSRHILGEIEFDLKRNETLCIVGESGSGKTVMMHALLGLLSVEPGVVSGEILVGHNGQTSNLLEGISDAIRPIERGGARRFEKRPGWMRRYRKKTRAVLGRELGLIFQNPRSSLDPLVRVGKQVEASVRQANPKVKGRARRRESLRWLERVALDRPEEVYELYPHQLSGGMCQRVAIAQILALGPRIIIADEPTTGLDATIQAEILHLIRSVRRDNHLSLILITHDFDVVERMADRLLVLYRGRIVERTTHWTSARHRIHPYTRELMRSVRVFQRFEEKRRMPPESDFPNGGGHAPVSWSTGCAFAPRCVPRARGGEEIRHRCDHEVPPLIEREDGWWIRCHLGGMEGEEV